MAKLSVVITTYNNQDLIKECIESVAFADEIIVVDNGSSDQTVQLSEKLGAIVHSHKNDPTHLNASKNFGFKKASHEWILSLDSDERVEADLQTEILKILSSEDEKVNGYKIPRHNVIFGKIIEHGLWYPDYQVRLFRKNKGAFPNIHNHELLNVEGELGTLQSHILHYNYKTISQYIQKIDRQYSDNEVDTYLAKHKRVYWYDAIRFPSQDFLANYFARQGYKDGLHGLVLAILQAFYMFVVFAKAWEKQGFKEEKIQLKLSVSELQSFQSQVLYWYIHELKSKNDILAVMKLRFVSLLRKLFSV